MPNEGTEHRKLAAIMFTDMVGYSALMQRNEALALELIEEHHRLLRPIFPKFGGREIKSTGDGFLVEFSSALAAAQCAIEIQRTLVQYNSSASPERRYQVRIGVHLGDVVLREADIFGDGVNIAARIEPLAEAGGICLSRSVFDQVVNKLDAALVKLGSPELKNIQMPMEVYRVVLPWHQPDSSKRPGTGSFAGSKRRPLLGKVALVFGAIAVIILVGASLLVVTKSRLKSSARNESKPASPALPKPAGRITSLAVKPLDNLSPDTNQVYFADGMTEMLTMTLGNIGALHVRGRSSVMRYKGSTKSIPEMAKELEVDAVIEGSVQCDGKRARIVVQLVEGLTDRHLWATNYDRDLSDFMSVQSEVAQAIAAQIQVLVTPQEQTRLASARPIKPEAVECYLQGRYWKNKGTQAGLEASIEHFQEALRIEPQYAEAYVGLASSYGSLSSAYLAPRLMMPLARTNVLKALELDATLPGAHVNLGFINLMFDYQFRAAEEEFRRALKLNPNYADAYDGLAICLSGAGRHPEAIAQIELARRLDPFSLAINGDVQLICFMARQYDQVIIAGRRSLALDKDFAHAHDGWMGLAYAQLGDLGKAIALLEPACRVEGRPPMLLAFLAYGYALAGQTNDARIKLVELEEIAKNQYICKYEIATGYIVLREFDQAFKWLDEALEARADCIPYTEVDPRLDAIRPDPRYEKLLKKIKTIRGEQ